MPFLPRRHLLIALASATLLAACGGGDDDNLDDRADLADPKVRFVHAVPAGPDVTLTRDGQAEPDATDVAYLGASQYYDIGRGSTRFELVTDPSDTVLATETVDAKRGDKLTLVAVADASSVVDLVTISDPFNKSVASDNARVRFFNAAPNAGDLDFYLTAPAADLDAAEPKAAALGHAQASPKSGDDSIQAEGGTYRLRITAAGSKTVRFDADLELPRNGDLLLLAVPDVPPANGIKVLVVRSDDSSDPTDVIESR